MEIKIKTNEKRLEQCGWKHLCEDKITYRKEINGSRCLEVSYYNGHIVECDILIKWDFVPSSNDYVRLKDMEILVEELKKLEEENHVN